MKKLLVALFVIVGLAFVGLAVYYWVTPDGSLPHFFPGYTAGGTTRHLKHGLGALIVGLGCGVLAWFLSGNKATASPTSAENTPKE